MLKQGLKLLPFVCLIMLHSALFTSNNQTSQTIFIPRAIITDSTFDNALEYYRYCLGSREFHKKEHSQNKTHFSTKAFYTSSESGDELARYFFPNYKNTLVVAQDGSGDVGSQWIGLTAPSSTKTFYDSLTMNPQRVTYGFLMNFHATLDSWLKGLFFEGKIPVVSVRHELKIKKVGGTTDSTLDLGNDTAHRSLLDAFNYSGWRYGKLSTVALIKQGIDDVLFRLGYNFVTSKSALVNVYADMILPMGERPTAEYLFEPLVGSKHFAVGGGINLDALLYKGTWGNVSLVGDARYHFRCSAPELRMLDLKANGHWSRYIQLVHEEAPSNPVDGINILTRDVDVHPGSSIEGLASLHYQYKKFRGELGCNIWYRGRESLEMNEHWNQEQEQMGIYTTLSNPINGPTASTALISQDHNKVTRDSSFVYIKESDFDLAGASHKEALSYKIFGGITADHTVFNFPASVGIGYSYEFARSNTAVNQWSLWLSS